MSDRLFDLEDSSVFGPPPFAGVYAICFKQDIFSEERILYIGSSKNIKRRLLTPSHHYIKWYHWFNETMPDALVYTKSIRARDFKSLERELIRIYKPVLNIQIF